MKEIRGLCVSVCLQKISFRFENCSFLSLQNTVDCIYPWTHHRLWKLSQMFPRRRYFEIHRYLLIQNLHLLLWGSPRCFCGSQYASEGIFANLANIFDSLGWENSETQTFDVIWNRAFTGRCNRRVLYVYQDETCPSVAVGGFCSKRWKKTWLIAVEFCFKILCK